MVLNPAIEFSKTQLEIAEIYNLVELLIEETKSGDMQQCRAHQRLNYCLKREFSYFEGDLRRAYINITKKEIVRTIRGKKIFVEEEILSLIEVYRKIYRQNHDRRLKVILNFLKSRYLALILIRPESEIEVILSKF